MHVIGDEYWSMTDGAVVVVLLLLRCVCEFDPLLRAEQARDYVLMLIVRKLDRELQP